MKNQHCSVYHFDGNSVYYFGNIAYLENKENTVLKLLTYT